MGKRFRGWTHSEKHDIWYRVKRTDDKKLVDRVEVYDPRTDITYLCQPDKPGHFSESRSSWSVKWYDIRLKQFNMSQHALAITKAILFPEERAIEKSTEQQLILKF